MKPKPYMLRIEYRTEYEKSALWLLERLGRRKLLRWEVAGARASVAVRARLDAEALRCARAAAGLEGISVVSIIAGRVGRLNGG
jgi:hypothetical protein